MTVAIFGNIYPQHFSKYIQHLIKRLENENINLIIEQKFNEFLQKDIRFNKSVQTFSNHQELKDNADFLFSIGGDGTLLKAVTYIQDSEIPVLGVNTGRLGFIASVSANQIDESINDIIKDNYEINERILLELNTSNELFKHKNFALNEVAVSKKDTSSMIKIDAFIDDQFLNTYWADGLVVSTPTGSTGYSLSCGGPIIMPGSNNIIITPNAPHNLNVRPIVISDNKTIKLKVEDRDQLALVSLDSRHRAFNSDTTLTIKKADFKVKLITPKENTFTSTIRNKLMWGVDKRSK
ncbi:MAG: NAD kinase [Flavobacteriales bacterium]|nr:NAD kinase [Flavobacteriales bacterium]MBH70339.1 NAD kinase [Flavobacteriales bacterium]|tara:strand:- start:1837 stop:2718 length:882 start_codon:yes stop_codon:yes gene_type:complete